LRKVDEVACLLIDVEAGLRQLDLWERQPPPAEALASTEPFAIDTLNFAQWLQHIFLPTMQALLAGGHALPTECGIAPMAQEYFSGLGLPSAELEKTLLAIDLLLSGGGESI
jgi:uncharacterized protein YqcC (DUF446 family)